jgi:hypothetical protein
MKTEAKITPLHPSMSYFSAISNLLEDSITLELGEIDDKFT